MSKRMTESYDHPLVQNALENQVVAVRLQGDSEACLQFSQIYPVVVFPSSFFIGLNGIPLEVIAECLEPAEFVVKVEKVIQSHQSGIAHNQPQATHSTATGSVATSSKTDHGQLQHEMQSKTEPLPSEAHSQAEEALQNQPSCTTGAGIEENESALSPENEEPLSSEQAASKPLEERVDRAKQLLAQKKEQMLIEAQEKAKADELDRRRTMKEMQKAREQQRDNELKEWAMSRAKDKEEERLVRERVKAQIAQDRADRAAKYQQARTQQERESSLNAEARQKADKERAAMDAAARNQYARIQFRLADGSSVTHQFSADDTLEDVRNFVARDLNTGLAAFSLCTTFPRRHFTRANYPETLRTLQLSPSSVLLILPEQAIIGTNRGGAGLTRYIWALLSPLVVLWGFVYSFFFGNRSTPSEGASNVGRPQTQNERQNDSDQQRDTGRKEEPRNLRRSNSSQFYHQEGNVYRINNRRDDSDDNNTWNGNSTQQM